MEFFRSDEEVKLEVRIEDDTVWLNRQQLAVLFGRDVKTMLPPVESIFYDVVYKGF